MKGGRERSSKMVFSRLFNIFADLIFELMYSGYNPVGEARAKAMELLIRRFRQSLQRVH